MAEPFYFHRCTHNGSEIPGCKKVCTKKTEAGTAIRNIRPTLSRYLKENPKTLLAELTVFNCTVSFSLTTAGVHLISDAGLHCLIRDYPVKGVHTLAENLKEYFEAGKKRPLQITAKSLAAEIRGHYYFEKLYAPLRRLLRFFFLYKITDRLDRSLEEYDCGEAGSDPNRIIWDVLSRFDGLFSFFVRDKA